MTAYGSIHAVLAAIIVLLGLAHLGLWVVVREKAQAVIGGLYLVFAVIDFGYFAGSVGSGVKLFSPHAVLVLTLVDFTVMIGLLPTVPWVLLGVPLNLPRRLYRASLVALTAGRTVLVAYQLSEGADITLDNVTLATTSSIAIVQGVAGISLSFAWLVEVVLALRRKNAERFVIGLIAFGALLTLPASVHGMLFTLGVAKGPLYYGLSSLVFLFVASGYLIRGSLRAARRSSGVGGYRIVSKLGAGGMGETFIAVREGVEGFSREVVLKKMRVETDPIDRARFLSEAKLAATLRHPNLVDVLDLGELDGGGLFIAMELIDGATVSDLCRASQAQQTQVPATVVAAIGAQLCRGLAHAHQHGVLHRDIKRANVMVSVDGVVKLIDFGLAQRPVSRRADEGEQPKRRPERAQLAQAETNKQDGLTQRDTVIGTPGYLAPERLRGEPATVASDLFAVGVLLYELLAGHRPFEKVDGEDDSKAVLDGRHKPLQEIRHDVPAALLDAIESCLSVDPSRRPAGAAALAHQLTHAVDLTDVELGPWVQKLQPPKPSRSDTTTPVLPLNSSEAKTKPLRENT